MLKSCSYCGRIHEDTFICLNKKNSIIKRRKKINSTNANAFRSSYRWQSVREKVLKRDRYLCLICQSEKNGTGVRYTSNDLEVHHIIPIEEDYSKREDLNNLITVCHYHHELCEKLEIDRGFQKSLINEYDIDN